MQPKKVIAFDIESTGTNPAKDRIVEIALIKLSLPDFQEISRNSTRVNPGIPIPKGASDVHGITDEMVIDKPLFSSIAAKLFTFINNCDYLLTHNGKKFDRTILYEEFARCGFDWQPKPIIDTYVIMSNKFPRTLTGAYKFYCEKDLENAHDAGSDIVATIEILKEQIIKHNLNAEESTTLDEILINTSKYEKEDLNLTWDGKLKLNQDGFAVWNFGKWKDKKISETDLGYINWVLMNEEYSNQTKNILRAVINQK